MFFYINIILMLTIPLSIINVIVAAWYGLRNRDLIVVLLTNIMIGTILSTFSVFGMISSISLFCIISIINFIIDIILEGKIYDKLILDKLISGMQISVKLNVISSIILWALTIFLLIVF